jgi:hypothetical protein
MSGRAGRRRAAIAGALAISGCILESEPCGQGFRPAEGRCVAFGRLDAGPEDGGVPGPDAGPPDADAPLDARRPPPADAAPDAEVPGPLPEVMSVLVVDRTPDALLGRTPSTPGCDLDGIELRGPGLSTFATKVLSSLVFDPFDQSVGVREDASLGAPEQTGAPETFVSLGGGGGYQLLHVQPQRPVARGDRLRVVEFSEPDDVGDLCAIWVCSTDQIDLSRCLFVGEGRGGTFEL